MIHIIGAQGMIGLHLSKKFKMERELTVHKSGSWNFSSVARGDTVFYLRSVSSPHKVMMDPISSKIINVSKTIEAVSTMLSMGARIIFASSDVVYGDTQNSIAQEETATNPYGEYAIQKASVEEKFRSEENFLSLRISSVIGEGSRLRKLLLSEQDVGIFDPVIRTPIHINDLVVICEKLLTSNFRNDFPHGVLNVGGAAHFSNFEVAMFESKAIGVKSPVIAHRTALDKACRPGTVRMSTKKAQDLANIDLDITRHYKRG